MIVIKRGDCLTRMDELEEGSIDALISDPPYEIGFMSKGWDRAGGIATSKEYWDRVWRILAPGGVVKVFGGTRTFHRMAVAMVQAGFTKISLEAWVYGSGFPKNFDIARAIDKKLGVKRTAKIVPFTGNALMRHGGDNTRPWMEEALKKGFHEMPGDEAVSDEARKWKGWGTALKPAWEPVLIARKIV